MKKVLLILAIFYVGLILFMPKVNLYYTLEAFLEKERVVLQEDRVKDRWIDLHIEGATLLYDLVPSITVESLHISPWLFYNTIIADNVRPEESLKKMFDMEASRVEIKHSVLDYKSVAIYAEGDFGTLEGSADLIARKLRLVLLPSTKFSNNRMLKRYFKKSEEGLVYESKF